MSRDSTSSVTSAAAADLTRFRALVEVWSLSTGTTRVCNGANYVLVGANTYSPIGGLGSIDAIQEDTDAFARGVKMRLAAVNTAAIADMLAENLFTRPVKIYRAFLGDDMTLVGTPQLMHVGYINKAVLKYGDPTVGYYEIESESRLYQGGRSYYLNAETLQQQMGFTGDTFFDYAPQIPTFKSTWGGMVHGLTHAAWKNSGYDAIVNAYMQHRT